jgi:hypothetical protein
MRDMTLLKHCQRGDCDLKYSCYLYDPHPENPLRNYLVVEKTGDECSYYAAKPSWGNGPENDND